MDPIKIYLDLSAWNRPFDDWADKKVKEEALATMEILEDLRYTVISSRFALRMIKEISDHVKYDHVSSLLNEYTREIIKERKVMLDQGITLQRSCNLSKLEDGLHIVLASYGKARYFVTTDQEILNKSSCIIFQMQKLGFRIDIVNPKDLVKKYGSGI